MPLQMPLDFRGPLIRRRGVPDDPDQTKAELLERARQSGIEGRWTMSKRELAEALRSH